MNILVVGLGVSGEAAARYCLDEVVAGVALNVTAVDADDTEALRARAEGLRFAGGTVVLGVQDIAGTFDLAIMSPGVPPTAPLFRAARRVSTEVVSEIEFAFRRSQAPWIAVTGTNGKTTVTSLVGHLLAEAGVPARVVGNIGTPAITAVAETGPAGAIVAEVSSFQLALTDRFHPRVAVLLNITPDHIDWHGTLEAYATDKAKIFANLDRDDAAIIDVDDDGSRVFREPVADRGVHVVPVSNRQVPPGGVGLDSDGFLVTSIHSGPVRLINRSELQIHGPHNVSNACAAVAAVLSFGVAHEDVRIGLRSFLPLEHRLEPVAVVGGVEYFNDSKATNPGATMKAFDAFEGRRLVALLGGRNKGASFNELARIARDRGVYAVVFGEAAGEIADALTELGVPFDHAPLLADAVGLAARVAEKGAVVVLSPACASFDEFSSYVERGQRFKTAVAALAAEVV